jgi:predicted negative regulator of RcsB-dependent stress response
MSSQAVLFRPVRLGKILRGSPGLAHYIFALVLVLRLIALARLSASSLLVPSDGDMHFYDDWARRIARGEWTDHLAFYGLPGYAYLLALLYKIFGYSPFVPGLFQSCLDAGTAVLIYKISVRIFAGAALEQTRRGQIAAVLAALGWAFFTPAEAYSIILMPTAGLVFVFWLVVWDTIKTEHAVPPIRTLVYGIVIGLTATAVATILFLAPLLLAALFLKRDATMPKCIAAGALFVFGLGLGTAPCWVHNAVVARDPVFLSAHSGINLWLGNNPDATGYPRFPGLHAGQTPMLRDSIQIAESAAGRSLKRSEVSAYWATKARAYIAGNFASWLKLMGRKIANFWNAFEYDDLGVIENLRAQGIVLPGLRFGLVAVLAIPGIFLSVPQWRKARWLLAAFLLHLLAVIPIFVTERYRLAIVPGLLIFAAFGVVACWQAVVEMQYRRCASYFAILILAGLLVTIPRTDPTLWATVAYNSGRLALEANDLGRAENNLERAYAYVPGNPEVNFALGNLRLAKGDSERARAFYRATLELDPSHKGALRNLGVLALEKNDWNAAAEYFRSAIQGDPLDAKTHFLLARALLEAGDLAQASTEIQRTLQLKPDQKEFVELAEIIRSRQ